MKRIRVLQINKLYYPTVGGIENLVKSLAEGINHSGTGVVSDVLVCQEKGRFEEEIINDVTVYKAASFGVKYSLPLSIQFFIEFFRRCKQYDIIHLHMPFPISDLALFLSGYKGKVILWWHSDIIRQKKALAILKPFLRWTVRRADLIITATENHITSSTFIGAHKEKCRVIPYGIDIQAIAEISEETAHSIASIKEKLAGKKCVLFVGRLVYYKGVEVLLEAMGSVDAMLTIIGDGPLKQNLEEMAEKLSISDNVQFLGKQSDASIVAWYHACDVFVLPSIANSEAFGLVQLEAMACGKPVVNTNLPTGVPFVSLDGLTGRTVPVSDPSALSEALQELLSNDNLREAYGRNAKERAFTFFTRENMVLSVLQTYNEILETN